MPAFVEARLDRRLEELTIVWALVSSTLNELIDFGGDRDGVEMLARTRDGNKVAMPSGSVLMFELSKLDSKLGYPHTIKSVTNK